jgi:hypothetical protein
MAIMLPNLRGKRPITRRESSPLEVLFKCADGIELHVPAESVFRSVARKTGRRSDDEENLRGLLRELTALKQGRKR